MMLRKSVLLVGLMSLSSMSAWAAVACPSQDFKVFLNAFADSAKVQKAFTQMPNVNPAKLTFPIIPGAKARKKDDLNLSVAQLKKNSAKVVLDKSETDYRIEFYFEKKECWMLVRAEDVSG